LAPDQPLTPTESQVALLVSWGATNRQVEVVLRLDPRAVERHLSEIYRKLGFRSRAELSRAAVGASPDTRGGCRQPWIEESRRGW
jgi:DNA-binding NarL/FixJ family response regulator